MSILVQNGWNDARVSDLRRFVAVVDAGSFSEAARQLGETPKQVSRRVGQLERATGLTLFQRTTRTLHVTLEGRRACDAVRSALATLELGVEDLVQSGIVGLVRVQVPSLLVDAFVDWLGSALVLHPELTVDVLVADRVQDLIGQGLDLALTGDPGTGTTVLRRRMGTFRPGLFASDAYVERRGLPSCIEDLSRHAALRYAGSEVQCVWPMCGPDGSIQEVRVAGRVACSDSRALLRALHAGLGIGPLPPSDPPQGLVRILPAWTMAPMDLYAVLAPGRQRLARVRFVLAGMQQIAERATAPG